MSLYRHVPHPHIEVRKQHGPVKVADQAKPKRSNWYTRGNARVAIGGHRAASAPCPALGCSRSWRSPGCPTAIEPGNIGLLLAGSAPISFSSSCCR